MTRILITGVAGFIGFHLARYLLMQGLFVIGVDSLTHYYDTALKKSRLALLQHFPNFCFENLNIADAAGMARLVENHRFDSVINLAGQAGVRYSLENPHAYVESNVTGFINVLEACRHAKVKHLIFASSSSVYGANDKLPFSEHDSVDHPVSLYAATKRSNELLAHSYAHTFGLPVTGLRFFSVYGPWGRPDMAYYAFTRAIVEGTPIDLYNYGHHKRDMTYVDDVVQAIALLLNVVPTVQPMLNDQNLHPANSFAPFRLFNVGNRSPVEVGYMVEVLEGALQRKAIVHYSPMQPGDVLDTFADTTSLSEMIGFEPCTTVEDGLGRFVHWYREYHHV